MRIGIDARALIGPRTGIGRFLEGLVRVLGARHQEHQFVLYAPRPLSFSANGSPSLRVCIEPGIRGVPGTIWLQTHVPLLARRDRLDVFWGAMFHLPVMLPPRVPAVVTVHDLVHLFFPHTMTASNYWTMKVLLRPSLWRAQHVTADSHVTAGDLQRMMRVPPAKVTVVYPGVSPAFHPRDAGAARRKVADAFGLSASYLLAVATLEPRKNLHTLIQAISTLPESIRRRWPLVVAGGEGWKNSSVYAAAAPLVREGSVRFLGYVADESLPWLYAAAALLVFPSVYEGFGIPVAEAMACGLPTIVSDIPVMREVAEGASIYVPPRNPAAWSRAILQTVEDERQLGMMREAGLARAREFRPEKSARLIMTILEQQGDQGAPMSS